MKYRQLGRSELRVSAIGLGCVTFGREIDRDAAFRVMDRALERGITLFDTAEAYSAGGSERIVGRWLADRGTRDRVVLTTKVAVPLGRERVLRSAEESLGRLGVDGVDVFYLHSFDPATPLEETLGALDTLVREGKTRCIACSNFDAGQLRAALDLQARHGWARFEAVQPIYNFVSRDIEAELVPLCRREAIGVVSYSPLGAGFLTGKYRRGEPPPAGARFDIMPGHQRIYFHDEKWRMMEALRELSQTAALPGAGAGGAMARLALAWVLRQPGITSVLIGARETEQVDQAFEAQRLGLPDAIGDALGRL